MRPAGHWSYVDAQLKPVVDVPAPLASAQTGRETRCNSSSPPSAARSASTAARGRHREPAPCPAGAAACARLVRRRLPRLPAPRHLAGAGLRRHGRDAVRAPGGRPGAPARDAVGARRRAAPEVGDHRGHPRADPRQQRARAGQQPHGVRRVRRPRPDRRVDARDRRPAAGPGALARRHVGGRADLRADPFRLPRQGRVAAGERRAHRARPSRHRGGARPAARVRALAGQRARPSPPTCSATSTATATVSTGSRRTTTRVLRGTDGHQSTVRDVAGNSITLSNDPQSEAHNGQDLQLGLDSEVQYWAEQAIAQGVATAQAASGTLIMMDTKTGLIKAWAQAPTYNANSYWTSPVANFRDLAVANVYEPGSVREGGHLRRRAQRQRHHARVHLQRGPDHHRRRHHPRLGRARPRQDHHADRPRRLAEQRRHQGRPADGRERLLQQHARLRRRRADRRRPLRRAERAAARTGQAGRRSTSPRPRSASACRSRRSRCSRPSTRSPTAACGCSRTPSSRSSTRATGKAAGGRADHAAGHLGRPRRRRSRR